LNKGGQKIADRRKLRQCRLRRRELLVRICVSACACASTHDLLFMVVTVVFRLVIWPLMLPVLVARAEIEDAC